MTATEGSRPAPPAPPSGDRARVAGLVAVLAVLGVLAVVTGTVPAVAFVLAIVLCVMIHEAGHYVAARRSGMKVTEFFFGFGPALWSVRRGETTYGIKAVPAGGYVKIIGMSNLETDIDPADEPRTYRRASYPRRLAVALAGVATHFVIAFVLLMVMWTVVGFPRYDRTLTVGSVGDGSPAAAAGFEAGDRLVAVDGQPIESWESLPPYIQARPGEPVRLVVERDGRRVSIDAVPAAANPLGEPVGYLGIGPALATSTDRVGPVAAVGRSLDSIGEITVGSVRGLASFFSPDSLSSYGGRLFGDRPPSGEVSGGDAGRPVSLVGIVRLADQAANAESGLFLFLSLVVLLNIFLAILNLVPLPPFDGGHVALATYERLRTRKGQAPYRADASKLMPLTAAVVAALVVLGGSAILLDLTDPLANPFG